MADLLPFGLPRDLRGVANDSLEDAVRGLWPEAQQNYRQLLVQEADRQARGEAEGELPPPLRALNRLLAEIAVDGHVRPAS